jgi:hypothetical protein
MIDLEDEMFYLIRTVVFAGSQGQDIYYESEIEEAARLIAGFINENYNIKVNTNE